ncbi:MAG: hypothetical protein IPN95_18310 [Bacteroidetes bacterium]|nr:hypothetical protein [Bacteroidota bacterium]
MRRRWKSNVLVSKGRTGIDIASVTNIELVSTGKVLSSPSLKLPAMALTRCVTA